jgi:hypothetical protein
MATASTKIFMKWLENTGTRHGVNTTMEPASYYRQQAGKARRLADGIDRPDVAVLLRQFAQEYDEIAEDLETGGIEIRHKERLPQYRREVASRDKP